MNRYFINTTIFVMFLAVFSVGANAGGPQKIKWTDLASDLTQLKNPMQNLNTDQRVLFEDIEYWLSLDPALLGPDAIADRKAAKKLAKSARKKLTKQGIDIDDLYNKYGEWEDEIERRSRITVKKYNGRLVSLAGYLLPLDFSEGGVKEFLLVPYVGACIHVPPPPTNQMAFIRMKKPYKVKGLFDPVWVTGRMDAKMVSKNLSLVDGSQMLDVGYSLSGDKIGKYVRAKE